MFGFKHEPLAVNENTPGHCA